MSPKALLPSVTMLLLGAAGFAVWALFSLPLVTGRPGIREAWDTGAYWITGVPLLLLALFAAGYTGRDAPWKLALWTVVGHFVGMAIVAKPGADLGLLPLALIVIGAPAFGVLTGVAFLGRLLRRHLRPDGSR